MEFNNQFYIFEDILSIYLTPKQCIKFYSSTKELYNIYLKHNKFKSNYFTPKDSTELKQAVNKWCDNREESIIKYGNINFWNTINIIDMKDIFYNKIDFNDDISDWNTSNVVSMICMFANAKNFNQPIGNWNIINVINIDGMFFDATNFNQSIENWNIINVIDMGHMFRNAKNFNKPLNNWNINNVKNMEMMFYNANNFNRDNCKDWELINVLFKNDMFN